MKKKMIAGAMVAAAVALGSMTAFAAGIEKVDIDGITFEIPEEIRDLVTVQTQLGSEDEIVMVSETASRDAALAMEDEDVEYAGWLFTITKMREKDVEKLRCGGMEGMNVFAEDDDIYYVFNHPTDVRFVREQYEDIDADMEQWNLVNEWAGTVCDEILGNNPELDAVSFSNTDLDMHLAKIAFGEDVKVVFKSLEFGELDPSTLKEDDYIDDLTDDVTFEYAQDQEAIPDGEYIVMEFPEENVRFDFFKSEENTVREVITLDDGEEITQLFKATFEEDADKTATGIMQAWCEAIAGMDD